MPIIRRGCTIKKLILIFALVISPALFADEPEVVFHNFAWGTKMDVFTAKMGKPAFTEEINGLKSLIYDKLVVSGYQAFMVVYFSSNGLEGGTYYFNTFSLDELTRCYKDLQKELLEKYGPTVLCDVIIKEMRPYESAWNLKNGYVYLKVNTRLNEPVTLWYSSPSLTKSLGLNLK